MSTHRRRFLRLSGVVGICTIAGCSDNSADGTPAADQGTPTEPTPPRQNLTQRAKLAADDGDRDDKFGWSVALSSDGSTALIGATGDRNPDGAGAGSAYVFDSSGGSWSQRAKLTADDGDIRGGFGNGFGNSAALSSDGSTALIGATGDEDPNGSLAGSAYVFDSSGSSWSQQAKLAVDDGDANDQFGESVALSSDGSTALIGADEDPRGEGAGSAYVFDSSGESWSQRAKLTADDGDESDGFGYSVALSSDGSTALVGARDDENPNGLSAGSAYIFDSSGESWSQRAKLTAGDGDMSDYFGGSVTLSSDGSTALIGATGDEDPNGEGAGSAYVFGSSGGSWSQQAKLAADDGDIRDGFGGSVTLSSDGSTALIGAETDEDPNGSLAGSVYVFDGSGGSWSQQAKLAAEDGDRGDIFGWSVALSSDGSTALIGANDDEDPNGEQAGSAYVFE
ncbi:FG-GAP repeat protein [Halomicroarcula sp. F28]|uniref:FG-GAP repeat protein n=1 Tax=Haloarcula salinisoli TaxID=2487746 RepID=UPI001C72E821|nr:FG-GAP repeat protein [Halomicroarcula salinisoli]MBX0286910.1 FG-GAP repeat protein [Halomicroarcula salinisoli]